MGYSLAVPCRGYALRDKMVVFLDEHWRTWPVVLGKPADSPSFIRQPMSADLCYHHGRCFVGIDYSAGGAEQIYAFAFIRWVAIKVGRRTFTRVPLYVYDGSAVTGILVDGPRLVSKCDCCDRWGVPIPAEGVPQYEGMWDVQYQMERFFRLPNGLDIMRQELQRLDALWERTCTG